ncbi:60S acidic ribosomal protein P2, partial [Lemmus lemmus]
YVTSYLLAALGGNSSPSAKDIKKILDSLGIEADDDWLNKVISELNGKNIEGIIAQVLGNLPVCLLVERWLFLLPLAIQLLLLALPPLQQRRRKMRRRRSPKSRIMTWDLACWIKSLFPCK